MTQQVNQGNEHFHYAGFSAEESKAVAPALLFFRNIEQPGRTALVVKQLLLHCFFSQHRAAWKDCSTDAARKG